MKVVEDGKRNIRRQMKRREIVNPHLRGGAGVELVTLGIGVLEENGGHFVGNHLIWRLVFDGLVRGLADGVNLNKVSALAGFPFLEFLKNAAAKLPTADVEAIHIAFHQPSAG